MHDMVLRKKEQIIDTHKNLRESPKSYAEEKKRKANPKRIHTVWLHLYNIFETFLNGE